MRKVANQTTFYKVHTISIHHKWALEIKSKKIIIVEFHHNTYFVNVDVTTVLIKFLYGKIKHINIYLKNRALFLISTSFWKWNVINLTKIFFNQSTNWTLFWGWRLRVCIESTFFQILFFIPVTTEDSRRVTSQLFEHLYLSIKFAENPRKRRYPITAWLVIRLPPLGTN